MYSLIIPVYRNEESIPELLDVLEEIAKSLDGKLEVVFVIDGSPDKSFAILNDSLPHKNFKAILIEHSRNFGSISAVRTGLSQASGPYFAVMAADLQEPADLILKFFNVLKTETVDVTVGQRKNRNDPLFTKMASRIYWAFYRKFVQEEMPPGGADVFGCNLMFRNQLIALPESNSSLVGLLFWMGFRRQLIEYDRLERRHGVSAWSLRKKLRYMMDSMFAFTDLPIRILIVIGVIGFTFFTIFSAVVLLFRITGLVQVPGYAATILTISFFAALNTLSLGVIGSYVWRAFENTKGRPLSIVMTKTEPRNRGTK